MKLTLILSLLLLVCSFPARSAEWKTSFNAEMEAEAVYWTEGKLGPDTRTTRGIFTAKTPFSVSKGRSFRFRGQPVVQWDPGNASHNERFFFDAPEAYFQWRASPWTVQAGMNVFTWGDTDVFNPLDVVNARRFYDPFRSEKLGAPALAAKHDFESFFVEAIYIPSQRKTRLPGVNSRWIPRDVFRVRSIGTSAGAARLILPSNLQYRYVADTEVDHALDNNFGLRFKFRFTGFDWTVAAFQGAATAPDVRPREVTLTPVAATAGLATTTFLVDPDLGLQAAYYPARMTGTSFVWVLGNFLVKGASAYTHVLNRRFDLPARIWENVLGVERTFGVGKGSLTALIQGTHVDRGDALETSSTSLARMFDRGAMGALRWAPNDKWTATLSYLRDTFWKGDLWHGEATYKIADGWRAKVAGDVLDGPTETPLGTYKKNDRATVSLLAQF